MDLIGFDLQFHFQSWNRFYYQIYLRSFCIIFSETRRLWILVRPSLATDRISSGFWLNISFFVNNRRAFRSVVAIAIDLLTRKTDISSESERCLCCDSVCDPSRIIATWFSYSSVNPLLPQNCLNLQSDLSCLYKLNCNIFNHHERLYFSLHRPASAIRHTRISSSWLW